MSTLIRDYERFAKEANEICKGRVYTDHLRRYAYGVDASCYSYLPKVVVKAEDEREVRRLIRLCQQCGTPLHSVRLAPPCLVNAPVKMCSSYVMMASRKWKLLMMGKP